MIRKTIICLFLMFSVLVNVNAQSMRNLWLSMPDSIVGYMDKNSRTESLDYLEMKVKSDIKNMLGETSSIDTITNDFLSAKLSSAMKMTIKKLPVDGSDSLLCMVRTYTADKEKESSICFFNYKWEPMKIDITIPIPKNGNSIILQQNISSSDILVIQLQPKVFIEDKDNDNSTKSLTTLKWNPKSVKYTPKSL
ncbi:MAG: DUF3256 family protein [Prevotella sp.]|nr:DUF3256 family protein [Prevotella sp.]MBP9981798.1 DUF3256 family protein [Prevotella sp.]MCI1732107.1 DUF3256 family protein [Prevotella sp.]